MRFLRRSEVLALRAESQSTYYVQLTQGIAPPQIKTTTGRVVWLAHEIEQSIKIDTAGTRCQNASQFADWLHKYATEQTEMWGERPGAWFYNRANSIRKRRGWKAIDGVSGIPTPADVDSAASAQH